MTVSNHPDKIKELLELVYEPVPKLKKIELVLGEIHPATLSDEIEKDVGFAYMMDYYFRLTDKFTVKSILQNPMFSHAALTELFYCQITAIHKAKLLHKPVPDLISSYWSYLSKAQYAVLLKNTISRTWNLEPAKGLIARIDLVHIKMLTKSGTVDPSRMLHLFKSLGSDIKKVFSEDMNIYDYAFGLAVDGSDTEFLSFLENYTMLFVQLRIASSFADEMDKAILAKGSNLSYPELHGFFANVPQDSLEVCLEIFRDKGWIRPSEAELILESYLAKKSR